MSAPKTKQQLVVPLALIVRGKRLLLTERLDPRPNYNKKWEFPGGEVEFGETVEACLHREVREETGFRVKLVEQLPGIYTKQITENYGAYQVFLINFICRIRSGTFTPLSKEVGAHRWCTHREALRLPLLPLNKKIITDHKTVLKKYID